MPPAGGDGAVGVGQGDGERLLDDGVDAALGAGDHDVGMLGMGGADARRLHAARLQHRLHALEGRGAGRVPLDERRGLARDGVSHRHQGGLGELVHSGGMDLGDEAGAGDAHTDRLLCHRT